MYMGAFTNQSDLGRRSQVVLAASSFFYFKNENVSNWVKLRVA
jgi:hypothetical protein